MIKRYRSRERAAERNYDDKREEAAFRLGYSHGYSGSLRTPRESDGVGYRAFTNFPNAWNAGYWEGFGDSGRS